MTAETDRQELDRKVAQNAETQRQLSEARRIARDTYTCEQCEAPHTNEFSRTCGPCDTERESGTLTLPEN
jgi:hypothetical protein